MRQLFFPTNIGNYINSQTNLSFIHQNFISEFFLSYYIFLLLECTTICMQNFLIKKGRSLKISILPQQKNKSCKVLIQEEKTIRNSSKTISSASLSNHYFEIFTWSLVNCSFKISKIYLTQNIFSEGFTETWKRWKSKRVSLTFVNQVNCHGYIFQIFNVVFVTK